VMVVCLIHVGVLGSLQLVPQIQKELVVDNGVDVLGKLHKKEPITVVTLFDDGAYVELVVGLGPVAEEHGP